MTGQTNNRSGNPWLMWTAWAGMMLTVGGVVVYATSAGQPDAAFGAGVGVVMMQVGGTTLALMAAAAAVCWQLRRR